MVTLNKDVPKDHRNYRIPVHQNLINIFKISLRKANVIIRMKDTNKTMKILVALMRKKSTRHKSIVCMRTSEITKQV